MRLLLASSVFVLLVAGCSSSSSSGVSGNSSGNDSGSRSSSSTAGPCDPLHPPPTSLTNVIGAGKDANGNVYVLDEPKAGDGYRLFVSNGSSLVLQHATGSGETGNADGTTQDILEFTDPAGSSTAQTLFFSVANDKVTSMALGVDDSSSGQKGGVPRETLTLVDPSSLSGLSIVNLPRMVWTISDVSDGSVLVLTLAADDSAGTASAALFYGPPSHLQQATITNLSQSGSGDIYVSFTLGSDAYDAHIANGVSSVNSSDPAPAFDTIDVAGKGSLTLTERTNTSVTALSFVCN